MWSARWIPSSSPVNTAVTAYPRPIGGYFGNKGAAGFPPRLRSRVAGHGQGTRQCLRGAAGGFDCQPPAYRSQSLDRPPTTFFGDDPRRAGPDPGADRRTALPAPSHAGRASHRASGSARPTRDPHFVAQLYRGTGRCGARRRRGFALPPWSARGGRAVRPLEGIAGSICSGTSCTPKLSLCRKRRRVNLTPAPALCACDYVGIELEVNQGIVIAAGRRWTALRRMLIDTLRTASAA